MSDGTRLNSGSGGDLIWTEDTGALQGKIQRVKLALGAVDSDSGDVSLTNPIPVTYPSRLNAVALGEASFVVKATAGQLMGLKIRNRNASARFAMLFNSNSVPANGGVTPYDVFLLPLQSETIIGSDYFSLNGIALSLGIAIAVSSTESGTLTLATPADHDISAIYL